MPDFGFVGQAYAAPSFTQDTQECINWYPEIDVTKPQAERGVIALYPTPGLVTELQLPAGELRGFRVIPSGQFLYAVCADKLYKIDASFVQTELGSIGTMAGPVSITDNGVDVYLADGAARYSCNIGSDAFTLRNDGAFIGGTTVDELDNYIVYNRPDTNQWGCTNVLSPVSGGLNLATKFGSSDNIVALIADHQQIFLIGSATTEVWIDAGTFPFPFQRITGTSIQHGCAAPFSLCRFGESLAWLSKDMRGQGIVIQTIGYQVQRISTHAVENDIKNDRLDDAIAYSYQQEGHEFYVLTLPSADKTWVYDLSTLMWHKRASRDTNNLLHRHRGNCCALFQGKIVVGDYENGKIYSMSQSVFTEDEIIFPCIRRCPHITTELNRQFFHELQIQFQPGVGLATGQGSDPLAMLRWSNDGGATFGNVHTAAIGKAGQYTRRARWTQLGEARDRVFEVTVTDPVYRVVVSANLKASAGTH